MDRIQLRRDSSARWAEINPILLEGEVGYEIDTKLRKIGDGVNRWNDLEYLRAEGISQETGNSQNITMSQDAITRELSELGSEVGASEIILGYKTYPMFYRLIKDKYVALTGIINGTAEKYFYTTPIYIPKGYTIYVKGVCQGVSVISTCDADGGNIIPKVKNNTSEEVTLNYAMEEDGYIVICTNYASPYIITAIDEKPQIIERIESNEVKLHSFEQSLEKVEDKLNNYLLSDIEVSKIEGYYLTSSSISPEKGMCYTELIPVTKGEVFHFKSNPNGSIAVCVLYADEGRNSVLYSKIGVGSDVAKFIFEATEDGYVSFSGKTDSLYVYKESGILDAHSKQLDNHTKQLEDNAKTISENTDKIVLNELFLGYKSLPISYNIVKDKYVSTTGVISGTKGYFYTTPIPISKGQIVYVKGICQGVSAISTCDEDGSNINPIVVSQLSDDATYKYTMEEDGYVIICASYTSQYSIGVSDKNPRSSAENLTIASVGSKYMDIADVVVTGKDASLIITDFINKEEINSVHFTPDSIFTIYGEIRLKSGVKLYSNGAKFLIPRFDEYTLEEDWSEGDTFKVSTAVKDIIIGSYIQIYNGDSWITAYVTDISKDKRYITISCNSINANRVGSFPIGSTVRNVSSVFGGYNVKGVIIDGLNLNCGYPTNAQSPDTFWAQNGIHFDNSTYCEIKNCTINNGGRHGILFCDTMFSKILNTSLNAWGEHCIDLYSRDNKGVDAANIIENCVCKNAGLCGIQNHTGSGGIIINCICDNNNSCGICMQDYSNKNIVSNCICRNNKYYGIFLMNKASDMSILGCRMEGNGTANIRLSDAHNVTFTGNIMMNSKAMVSLISSRIVNISNNSMKNPTEQFIKVFGGCDNLLISSNILNNEGETDIVAIDGTAETSLVNINNLNVGNVV